MITGWFSSLRYLIEGRWAEECQELCKVTKGIYTEMNILLSTISVMEDPPVYNWHLTICPHLKDTRCHWQDKLGKRRGNIKDGKTLTYSSRSCHISCQAESHWLSLNTTELDSLPTVMSVPHLLPCPTPQSWNNDPPLFSQKWKASMDLCLGHAKRGVGPSGVLW